MLVLQQVYRAITSPQQTSAILVALPDKASFAKHAAEHVAAYFRSDCTDDECADNVSMGPYFEETVRAEILAGLSHDLGPRIMHSLTLFISHICFQDDLWIADDPSVTDKFVKPLTFPLMRRAITVDEDCRIKAAIASKNKIEETIFEIGSRTREWIVVFESPPDKTTHFAEPQGFPCDSKALHDHVVNVRARKMVPRILPPGVHMLDL